jgi:hypothetical protein
MSAPACTFIKPDDTPCAAHPLPGRPFCLFHDPEQKECLAQARSKGGATPRRRTRRFPRLLDHVHVAELLGELFIDALNHTDVSDTKRLQTLTNLSRVLLTAVGTPPTFLIHSDRHEPAPTAGHLLRVYPPLTPEVEALLEAEPPAEAGAQPPPPPDSPLQELHTVDAGDGDACYPAAEFLPPPEPAALPSAPPPLARRMIPAAATPDPSDPSDLSDPSAPSHPSAPLTRSRLIPTTATPEALTGEAALHGRAASLGGPPAVPMSPEHLNTRTPEHLTPEQALNRARTGPPSTEQYWDLLLAALAAPPPAPAAPPATDLQDVPSHDPSSDGAPLVTAAATNTAASPEPPNTEHLNTRTPERLNPEQVTNRSGTGPSPTNGSDGSVRSVGDPPRPGQTPAIVEPPNPLPAAAASSSPADEVPPEPEPRRLLVNPHAPWPGACHPTSGYVIRDVPFNPGGRNAR